MTDNTALIEKAIAFVDKLDGNARQMLAMDLLSYMTATIDVPEGQRDSKLDRLLGIMTTALKVSDERTALAADAAAVKPITVTVPIKFKPPPTVVWLSDGVKTRPLRKMIVSELRATFKRFDELGHDDLSAQIGHACTLPDQPMPTHRIIEYERGFMIVNLERFGFPGPVRKWVYRRRSIEQFGTLPPSDNRRRLLQRKENPDHAEHPRMR